MRKNFRWAVWLIGAVLTVTLPGCGGDSPSPSNPSTPTPTPTARPSTTLNFNFSNLDRGEAVRSDFSVTVADADASILMDWTFSTDDIDVFVTNTSCSATLWTTLFNQTSGCTSLIRGASTAKPERATGRLLQGNYRIWAASDPNRSRQTESGFIQLTITAR